MTARNHLAVAVAILTLVGSTVNGEVRYTMIDLGSYPEHGEFGDIAINNAGQVVGTSSNADGKVRATLFDTSGAGNHIDLGTLGGERSMAWDINNAGQIVGAAETGAGDMHATLFDPTGGGNNLDLGTLGETSHARGINDLGQIVGSSKVEMIDAEWAQSERATLFDPTGGGDNIDLGTLDGYTDSTAMAINNLGQIVGYAYRAESGERAVLFDGTGGGNNVDLGVLSGGGTTSSRASDINDAGQIVGWSWGAFAGRGTLFDPTGAGNNIDLGAFADSSATMALGINENGQVVGYGDRWSDDLVGGTALPMLLDATGANDPICLSDYTDLVLGEAFDINDSGWIVGVRATIVGMSLISDSYLLIPVDGDTQGGGGDDDTGGSDGNDDGVGDGADASGGGARPNGSGRLCGGVGVVSMASMIVGLGLVRISMRRKQE